MAALRLAVNNVSPRVHHRPFQTMYYRSGRCKVSDWNGVGRAGSSVGAVRAAVVRIFTSQYYKAIIHDEDGAVMYTITRTDNAIKIFGLFEVLDL